MLRNHHGRKCPVFGLFLLCSVVIAASVSTTHASVKKSLPEADLNAMQLIVYNGYVAQQYHVITKDGYKLTMHRIPFARNETHSNGNRPVVFLQHGLLASSTCWLTNPYNESLAYILADAGFDVFLGNFRGNTYSRGHVRLDPDKDHAYWEFSWDEMAKHDIPAQVNAALNVTRASSLYYIGHSQGTMTAFAQFSQDLEFAKKVKHFFALAPVAKVQNINGFLGQLGRNIKLYQWLLTKIDDNEFLPNSQVVDEMKELVCGTKQGNPLCQNVYFLIDGPNTTQLNNTRIPVYMAHNPAGTSTQNIIHFAQGVKEGTYAMYDYGTIGNLLAYRQLTPPNYHPERMQVNTTLFSGAVDWLADPTDVLWLTGQLTCPYQEFHFFDYNHIDFIWGQRAPKEIYSKIIEIIQDGESS